MYQNKLSPALHLNNATTAAPRAVTSTGVYGSKLCFQQVKINRIAVIVTTAVVADLGAPVITFRKRPTPGSSSGQSVVGTITVPDLAVVGSVYYKEINPVELDPGQELAYDVSTAATSAGSAAGAVLAVEEYQDDPEFVKDQANMIASV